MKMENQHVFLKCTKIEKWFYEGAPKRVQRRKERREESKKTIEFLSEAQHIEDI